MLLLLAVVGGGTGLLLATALPHLWQSPQEARLNRRLERYGRYTAARRASAAASSIFGQANEGDEHPWRRAWRAHLLRIGGSAVLRLLLAAAAATAVVVGLTVARLGILDPAHAAIAGAAVGSGLLFWLLQRRQEHWRTQFLDNFNDAIELIIRAVRAGIPVSEAIRQAGNEVNEPVRSEFRRIADSMDLGVDMREALRQAAERVRLPDFDFFVLSLVLQRETGGQLTDTLHGLTVILRRRKEIRLKVRAITAEGRTTAAVVGALPVAVGVLMFFINEAQMLRLTEPGLGRQMLIYGIVSMLVGFVIVHKLARVRS